MLSIGEDKFKASAGWVENFKHRHGIKKGVWVGKPHPGFVTLDITTEDIDFNNQVLGGPTPFFSDDGSRRHSTWPTSHPMNGVSGDPFSVSPEGVSNQSSNDCTDVRFKPGHSIYIHGSVVQSYAPGMYSYGPPTPAPTAQEANEAMEKVMHFVRTQPSDFLSQEETLTLNGVKDLLSMAANGLPDCRARSK